MACGIGVCLGCAIPARSRPFRYVCSNGPVFDAAEVLDVAADAKLPAKAEAKGAMTAAESAPASKVNLRHRERRRVFSNPILTASGTFGYGKEFEQLTDLNALGGLVTKGISPKPRFGNATAAHLRDGVGRC